jgi:HK97 gp10 family phage protein
MGSRVVINQSEWRDLFESENGPIAKELLRRTIKVENTAKSLTPVDTGRLRSSITHELGREGRRFVARVGTNVEYAGYVEFGTRRMRAQPYLRAAIHSAS